MAAWHGRRGVQSDGASHQYVVMIAALGPEAPRLTAFIDGHLIACSEIALDIGRLPDHTYQMAYNQRFGRPVGMKPDTHASARTVDGLPPVKIRIDAAQLGQYV